MLTKNDLPKSYEVAQCFESTSGRPGKKLIDIALSETNEVINKRICNNCADSHTGCSIRDFVFNFYGEDKQNSFGCTDFRC